MCRLRCLLLALGALALSTQTRGQQKPTIETPMLDPSGGVTITVHVTPGTNYALEFSGDLLSWWPVASAPATNTVLQFQFTPSSSLGARYFRARLDAPVPAINVTYQPDTNSLDIGLVTPDSGGTLSLTDTNGITYSLTVPTNAVTEPAVFELTLVTNITGLPFTGPNLGVVTLSPAGLVLAEPAQLEITFPTNQLIDPVHVAGYAFNDDGSYLRLNLTTSDTNSVVMPVFELGGYGCSTATLAEIEQMSRVPVSDATSTNRPVARLEAKAEHQPRSVYLPSFLDQCYPNELARAKQIDAYLRGELLELEQYLSANSKKIKSQRPDLGDDPATWESQGFTWDGNQDLLYSDYYDRSFAPYLQEAESNCALTEVMADRIRLLRWLAEYFGGTVIAAKGANLYLCTGYQHCLTEIDECCKTLGLVGPAAADEAQLLVKEAAYEVGPDCALDASQVGKDCQATWSGSLSVVQVLTSKTNHTEGSITTFDSLTEVDTIVYQTDATGLQAQSSPGFYGLTGNLNASGTCNYDELTITADSSCCGSCTTTTHSRSACTPKGTAFGTFAWPLTNSPPSPVPLPISSAVVPGDALTLATHGVKRTTHSTWSLSYLQSNPKGLPTCVTTGGQNNFTGKYDFSGIPYFNFQGNIEGTVVNYSGSYETNIVHPDGVTTTRIQASWNFNKKQ